MANRIVRLTESDINRLVRRIVNEEELSPSADEKNCVPAIRKFYSTNGFESGGNYGEGGMHDMTVRYERNIKGKITPEIVIIALTDWNYGVDFYINISIDGANIPIGNQGVTKSTNIDPNVIKLFTGKYTRDSGYKDPWNAYFKKPGLNCETAKSELLNNIKPIEQSLIRMGFRKRKIYS